MNLKHIIFLFTVIFLTSCGEVTQELIIERNDHTSLSFKTQTDDMSLLNSFVKFVNMDVDSLNEQLDTTFLFKDLKEGDVDIEDLNMEELVLLEEMGMNLSKKIETDGKKLASMEIFMEYNSEEERDKKYALLDKLSDSDGRKIDDPTAPSATEVQEVMFNYTNNTSLGILEVIDGEIPSDLFGGMDLSSTISLLSPTELEEMKLSFPGTMTKKITVPGKITKVSTENYTLTNDSTVLVPFTFFDIIIMGKVPGFIVEYDSGVPITDPKLTEVWEPEPTIVTPGREHNKAPSDAVILFGGKSADAWMHDDGSAIKWKVGKKDMTVTPGTGQIKTKESFGDCQLHIEWRSPDETATGQGKGNSGIFFQGLYELQVLNSYQNRTYSNGQAGSIYKQSPPLVNAMRKPGDWNVYDVIFQAPRFDSEGNKTESARITVLHNGVLIQNNTEILGTTEYIGKPKNLAHGDGPIILQDHSNKVSYRNIWLRKL